MGVGYNAVAVTDGLVCALDPGNPRSFSPNTAAYSTDLYSWTTSASNATLSRDTITSPVGSTPLKMSVTGNDPYTNTYNIASWNVSTVANAQTWTVSFYAKASTTLSDCEIYIFGADSTGVSFVGGSWIGITSKTITVTPEWQRFQHSITFNNASVAYIQMRFDGPQANGSGTTVWYDGLQVELGSTATTFNSARNTNWASINNLINTTVGSITSYPPFVNQALVLDGVNDQILCNLTTPLVKDFSFDFWMKSSAAVQGKGLIEYGGSTYGAIAVYSLGQNYSTFYFATAGGTASPALTKNLADNVWHNVVMTYDGTTGKVYVDGTSEITQTSGISGNLRATSDTSVCIGRWRGVATYQDATIGLLRVYNKALSLAEIQQNFNASRGRFGV